jgi:hypothetical protein
VLAWSGSQRRRHFDVPYPDRRHSTTIQRSVIRSRSDVHGINKRLSFDPNLDPTVTLHKDSQNLSQQPMIVSPTAIPVDRSHKRHRKIRRDRGGRMRLPVPPPDENEPVEEPLDLGEKRLDDNENEHTVEVPLCEMTHQRRALKPQTSIQNEASTTRIIPTCHKYTRQTKLQQES